MGFFSSLKRQQKESIGILQIGTFLESFDLILYVHMAVLLNEVFFPQSDPHTAALISALIFCSAFAMRPFGALLFGFIGDHIGRKMTVTFTTMLISVSCMVIANLPTYEQIGITAVWTITACRMVQGMASIGDIIGAEIYITETTKSPAQHPLASLLSVASLIGSTAALAVAALVTILGFNWRLAFWLGAIIALVGTSARARLRETPEFVDVKRRMKKAIDEAKANHLVRAAELLKKTNPIWGEKIHKKTLLAYFFIRSAWPTFFYFNYIYCGTLMRGLFGYTAEQVIYQNLVISLLQILSGLVIVFLSYRIYPLRIIKAKLIFFVPLMVLMPLFLMYMNSPILFFALQSLCFVLTPGSTPANAIFYKHFPILMRFTHTSFIFMLSQGLMSIVAAFGFIYLENVLNLWGTLVITLPILAGFYWGICHFERLDQFRAKRKVNPPASLFDDLVEPKVA